MINLTTLDTKVSSKKLIAYLITYLAKTGNVFTAMNKHHQDSYQLEIEY